MIKATRFSYNEDTVQVENFEVFLISRFSWVADDTKIIHVEGGINTREIWQNLELHENFHPRNFPPIVTVSTIVLS